MANCKPIGARIAWTVGLLHILAGCTNGVREDRTLGHSADGASVAFQHGDEGVFVASGDGQSLVKIFDDDKALAVSSPLWSPIDKRLVFTSLHPIATSGNPELDGTALQVAPAPDPEAVVGGWDENPDGRQFLLGQFQYTCWLREEPAIEHPEQPQPQPIALFTARCNHAGYVGANLAVRWHPTGQSIVYLDMLDDGQMGLFEFELSTGVKRQISEWTAAAVVFDWSPRGSYLTCTLLGGSNGTLLDGTWVVPESKLGAGVGAKWHLPHSERFAVQGSLDPLEVLRSARPVWSADEQGLVFIAMSSPGAAQPGATLYVADIGSQHVVERFQTQESLRDVHWHPDGKRVGFIDGGLVGKLRIVQADTEVAQPMPELSIRKFAGWDATGHTLSVVSPIPEEEYQHRWALLFPAIARARDRVYIADEDGSAHKLVHEGMRISFPRWSPTESKLSLWGTFTPSYRCWSAVFLPWSLRPGDPAAVLDCDSGELSWLAVSPQEKSQVGHYYLLKQEYQRAWEWYEQGAVGRGPAQSLSLAALWSRDAFGLLANDPRFFEYYCLFKLGRTAEAETRLQEFKQSMRFASNLLDPTSTEFSSAELANIGLNVPSDDASVAQWQQELGQLVEFLTLWLEASYASEVFLGLNAAGDGAAYFQRGWDSATSDPERFANGACLTQMQLADEKHAEYAEFVTDDFLPLLERLFADRPVPESLALPPSDPIAQWRMRVEGLGVGLAAGLSLLPLGSQDFMQSLEEEQVQRLLPVWQAMAQRSPLPIEVVVLAMRERVGGEETADWQPTARPTFLSRDVPLALPGDADELVERLSELWRILPMR
jgi:hypothetical protein